MIIPLSGINLADSDYTTPDGTLDVAINAIPRGGALQSFRRPATLFQLEAGERIITLHSVAGRDNYISLTSGSQLRVRSADGTVGQGICTVRDFADLTVIGNTLVLADADGLHYILWRDSAYVMLGDRPEFPALEFGLRYPQAIRSFAGLTDKATITISKWLDPNGDHRNWDAQQYAADCANFSNAVYGLLLPAVNDKVVSKGYFYQPFFVRYAFRLYDGSYRWHSAPVLMTPTGIPPIVKITVNDSSSADAQLSVLYFELCYKFTNQPDFSAWKDIISAIDIFISAPIYTYDQSSMKVSIAPLATLLQSEAVGRKEVPCVRTDAQGIEWDDFKRFYFTGNYSEAQRRFPSTKEIFYDHYLNGDYCTGYCAWIPRNEHFHEDVAGCCNFYLAQTIDPFLPYEAEPADENTFDPDRASKLPYWSYRRIEPVAKSVEALVASKRLPDEYQSHFSFRPGVLHAYNSRLNLADMTVRPPHPYPVRSFVSACGDTDHQCWAVVTVRSVINGSEVVSRNADKDSEGSYHYNYTTALKGSFYLSNLYGGSWWARHGMKYIYVPDPNAKSIEIAFSQSLSHDLPTHAYTLPLTPHPLLNGAYWYGQLTPAVSNPDSSDTAGNSFYDDPASDFGADISGIPVEAAVGSKIYTSEVNNPFVFLAANITTVGTGDVIALASAAKALSQGQFGQFPLYAFTTDGIWALEVSSTGGFSSRQPLSRDVCLSRESVTALDSAVLFASSRGIMLLSGSQVDCISQPIYNPDARPSDLARDNAMFMYINGYIPDDAADMGLTDGDPRIPERMLRYKVTTNFRMPAFSDMLPSCRMLYSYATQLLYVFSPGVARANDSQFAFVYSFDSHQWGGAMISIVDVCRAYPRALAVTRDLFVHDGIEHNPSDPNIPFEPLASPDASTSAFDKPTVYYHFSDFDQPDRLSMAFVCTRPLKLGMPDVFKTIREVHARGYFPRSSARVVLFAAREITGPWIIIGTSSTRRLHRIAGSPYKYFRVGIFLAPHIDGNSLSALELRFSPRYLRRLR